MTFLLNPYDAELDLSDKEDRKLFQDDSKDIKSTNKDKCVLFDGKIENFNKFSKIIGKEFHDTRVNIVLLIPTQWPDGGRKAPIIVSMVDIFQSYQIENQKVIDCVNMIWATTDHGPHTPKYYKRFSTNPADTAALNYERNQRRLKHIMLGNKSWNSLTTDFQLEFTVNKVDFVREGEYDGALLWDFICRRVNPSTTVGASKMKEDLERTTLAKFGGDVIQYNTWFENKRSQIIGEEGDDKYNEYLRNRFRAYLTSDNEEFLSAIRDKKRKWMQGKLPTTYEYSDLLQIERVTFNNLDAEEEDNENKNQKRRNPMIPKKQSSWQ